MEGDEQDHDDQPEREGRIQHQLVTRALLRLGCPRELDIDPRGQGDGLCKQLLRLRHDVLQWAS